VIVAKRKVRNFKAVSSR